MSDATVFFKKKIFFIHLFIFFSFSIIKNSQDLYAKYESFQLAKMSVMATARETGCNSGEKSGDSFVFTSLAKSRSKKSFASMYGCRLGVGRIFSF